ncbi:LysR family transcriptional regulator [Shinella sp. 838]|jgi:DNA-binding transcriptional LysR family regulator|uniref:LysR family transcriptional regulator n=1 Tax=unclassified Shinella TaxID=2643062 RepID=UPI0003C54930|nr:MULTISPECIES: LysR family transcriptional regulator [unclassified Shinella]EYR82189.1 LysR family transcriptional regulator [Shinella sp. DD12]MDG4675092.1 LysR family transcriptional regulator [Shinella sp. 838]TAA55869.1 LysR family transcriptional regulator [Shinella sp. JR1-6]
MLDRLTGMQVFVRTAQQGSLSAAARQMKMSPAMATKHVDALEERLGIKLFHRTTRKLSLNESGRQYLEFCLRILPDIEETEAAVSSQRIDVVGTLRLSAPISFGVRYIAPLVPEFSAMYPGVTVDLGLNDRYVDLIDEGWDMTVRIGRLADSRLIARRLAPTKMVVAATPAYLDAHGRPRRVGDLLDYNCLSYSLSDATGAREWIFGTRNQLRVPIRGNFIANNGDALVAAALNGQGILYGPDFLIADHVAAGRLELLPLDQPAYDMAGIFAVYPPDRRPPAKVRAMVDFLADAFAGVPAWQVD